ncbi:hypothetical protein SVA_2694 [Sulfurifustis variabilis]|uniref:Uncharacterized protein n=1 Tax=Sulfurifustis variabilis TaxID=1675686 RepID=A0A1B4V9A9_9GAMM|nr:hypothetical protein SVA_2694 [Sulfurifustis variabilis]
MVGTPFAVGLTRLERGTTSPLQWVQIAAATLSLACLLCALSEKNYCSAETLRAIVPHHGVTTSGSSYLHSEEGRYFEHKMIVRVAASHVSTAPRSSPPHARCSSGRSFRPEKAGRRRESCSANLAPVS